MRGNDAARYEAHLVGYGLKGRLANRCLGPVPLGQAMCGDGSATLAGAIT